MATGRGRLLQQLVGQPLSTAKLHLASEEWTKHVSQASVICSSVPRLPRPKKLTLAAHELNVQAWASLESVPFTSRFVFSPGFDGNDRF